jgi:superfamily II DNA or RNA helicase
MAAKPSLRLWQQEAMEQYRQANRKDFLVTATPGAGKTTFALTLANKLIEVRAVQQVVVVVPTDHLRTQWADSAIEKGIFLDPSASNKHGAISEDYVGYVVTYAQIASNPELHKKRVNSKKTFVIFDEIHHAGDGLSWGAAVQDAFQGATRRLQLTGTPFRTSPFSTIPFVRYDPQPDGTKISHSDYAYGYGEALKDSVVRPVTFAAYSGESTWQDGAGDVHSSGLLDAITKDVERAALKTALSPEGSWIPHVFRAAHERLMQIRSSGMPDAGGMVLASDQESAKAYAVILRKISRGPVAVVVSDDNKADKKIDAFRRSNDPWLVAVRMVSEGVDIPRLAVGVWATNYRTPLFFAQAVGRFVRARNKNEVASVFLPAIKSLLALAASMEEQRKHVINTAKTVDDIIGEEYDEINELSEEDKAEREMRRTSTVSSIATFDHVLFNGVAIDGASLNLTSEDEEYLGLPGLLSPEQMATLLRKRDDEMRVNDDSPQEESHEAKKNIHVEILNTRKEINKIVSRKALSKGIAHAHIHKLSQKAVPGPPTSVATLAILEKRLEWLQEM